MPRPSCAPAFPAPPSTAKQPPIDKHRQPGAFIGLASVGQAFQPDRKRVRLESLTYGNFTPRVGRAGLARAGVFLAPLPNQENVLPLWRMPCQRAVPVFCSVSSCKIEQELGKYVRKITPDYLSTATALSEAGRRLTAVNCWWIMFCKNEVKETPAAGV